MRIKNLSMQDSATDIGAGSTNLATIWLGHCAMAAIQLVFTGSPVGSFKLQASCDEPRDSATTPSLVAAGVTNWTDISGSSVSISAAGDIMWNIENPGYNFIRVVWTRTSGSGSLTVARINVKGI